MDRKELVGKRKKAVEFRGVGSVIEDFLEKQIIRVEKAIRAVHARFRKSQLYLRVLHPVFIGKDIMRQDGIEQMNTGYKWSIYGTNLSIKEWAGRFKRVHGSLKYRFLVPILFFADKLIRGISAEPSNEWNDKNLRAFKRAYDKAEYDWIDKWMLNLNKPSPGVHERKEVIDKAKKAFSVRIRRTIYKLLMVEVLNDTADRELFNMLMIHIAKEMGKEWKHSKGKVHHLVYSSGDISDVTYYMVGAQIVNGSKVLTALNDAWFKEKRKLQKRVKYLEKKLKRGKGSL